MFGYKKEVNLSYDKAIARVREELAREGFGVLTETDVKATLKKKLNADFEEYVILGTCNPPFAYRALQTVKDVGLMMPCNVVVFVDRGRTFVETVTPTVLMNLVPDERLKPLAEEIEAKLKKAIDNIR